MSDASIVKLLKIVMAIGLTLVGLGIYFHIYNQAIEDMGVTGIIISACCVAIGMAMSLPTKMYLTFVLVKREQEQKASKNSDD